MQSKFTKPSVFETHGHRSEKEATKEIIRAMDFFFLQIRKGWSISETMTQLEQSYGFFISQEVYKSLDRVLTKQSWPPAKPEACIC